ncbi:hypothetical protein OHA98_11545 [Streptomyces sp. NBC_00654]|uniref:hypothetical protein n=1 Tax=Streptomyces sp. NBC_00654 TaxID=2975799 RepID=UPI00225943AF|nr:hypothetical protein [Streptomyces sp. NBC_00654]MCX4965458.1 hypothetical protein [Streptomyces sp. NBC_00654]
MSAVATLVYTAVDRAAPESLKRPLSSSAAPGGTPSAEALTEEEPLAEPTETGTAARADISVARCARDSVIGWPEADVKVVNGSGSTADYIVFVEFVDKDGTQVSEGVTTVTGLAPGKSAKSKVQGLGEVPRGTKCRIAEVERTPSNG